MASHQSLAKEASATQEEISPNLDQLLKDVANELSSEELTNVVASIKITFKGKFKNKQDQDLYSCLHLFASQGLLTDQNLTLLEKFVACKSSKEEGIKQRLENFKLNHQLEVTPRQQVKGRDIDLDTVLNKLTGKKPIVNLYGSGGLGKTTLGKEICQKWLGKSIPVDLRGIMEMKDVYFHIMLALDTKRTVIKYDENPVIEQLEMLKKESRRDVLLLLDNVDQFSGGDDDRAKSLNDKLIAFLRRLVADDKGKDKDKEMKANGGHVRLKVLLISRTRFGGINADEHSYYELKALDEGFSEEILQTRVGGVQNMEVNQMKKLVELCKGKPLFLNGIAAILRQRVATAEKLLEKIEQELVTLKTQEKEVSSTEHDFLKQEREKWDFLSEGIDEEQLSCMRKMFFLLPSDTLRYSAVAVSLFRRPFSEEAAAFVLDAESTEAVIILEGLRNSEILSVDLEAKERLYDMHPMMKSFLSSVGKSPVFQQVYKKAEDRFSKIFMTKMIALSAMYDTDYVSAFQKFDHDKSNFLLALELAFKSDYLHVSKEFHEAIMVFHLFNALLDTRQRRKFFKSWTEATEEDGKEGSLFRALMRCFEALQVLELQGWKSAMEILKLAENTLRSVNTDLNGESYRLARSMYLYTEGEIYYRKGSVPTALKSLCLSLEIMEDLWKNHSNTVMCLNAIGNCYNKLGNAEVALKVYTSAYEMRKELSGLKNHPDLPFYKGQIGTAYEGQKQYDEAIQCYQEALELSKELKLSGILRLALFHRNIANAYAWKGEFVKAYKPAIDAYEIRKDILGDHPDTARSAFQMAEICRSMEEFDEAEEFYAEAWRIEKSLEHGNHSAVRDRIVRSYTFILRGNRKKEFQKEALEFYQCLWMEEKEFSFANKSIIDEINTLVSDSGDRQMTKKYQKEALQFYVMAWNSPDLQQLPPHQREDILQNILYLSMALREKEILKKYEGELLRFLEQQWEENKEMTNQDKIDILHTLQHLGARQGDERKREKYKKLSEDIKKGACFQHSNQVTRLSGTEVVPNAIPGVGDSGGENIGKILIVHKPELEKQFQVLEENNTGTLEETSTNKRGIDQEGDPQQCDPGMQFISKREEPGENKQETQGNTSKEKGVMPENLKEGNLRTKTKAATDIITSEGGVIRVEDVQFLCPPGAVDNPVSVKMTLESPVKHYGLIVQKGLENDVMFAAPVVHLQPNGHLFSKPVTLTTKIKIREGGVVCEDGLLVLHGTEARDGKISWQDVTQKSIISVANKEVSIEIERFSLIEVLWALSPIPFREIVSRFNLRPLNYTMSVLFNNSSDHELALVFMSQDIFHDSYYRENDASALVQLTNDGFKLMCSSDGPKDKPIYNSESLHISVRLGEDYKLANNQQSSVDVTVESRVWWSTGHEIRFPLEAIKNVRILCGRIVVQGQHGHTSEYTFCEQDLLGYVKRLLGVEGAIFNLKPIAEKIGTSEETMNKVMESWRNEHDQLKLLMEPWLKATCETDDLNNLSKLLEELKEEDCKVTQRGQMHIRHLRELAIKISDLKTKNAELIEYFSGKVQTLCDGVLRDCCIQVENSVEDVERGASSEDYVNYLEVHMKVSPETVSKYQRMCSSSEESIVKSFLAIVPQLIQDIKAIFHDEIKPDVQNGLKGLNNDNDALNELASSVREAEENNKIRKLVCEVCKILEDLCVKNCDSQHSADLIHKWGSSLGVLPMLDFLKPFFQTCPQDIRLHKRLELFACRIRDIMSDVIDVDEVFMRDFFDVSSSLIHFARFDPTKLVRFQLSYSTRSPVTCKRKGVEYDSQNDTFSESFLLRKEDKEELLLHAVARVHAKERVCNIGAFQSVIMLPASAEEAFKEAFKRCKTDMTQVTDSGFPVAKQEVKVDSQTVRVVLCSTLKERLALLLGKLKSGELRDVVDWKGSQITPCHLTIRTHPTKPGTVLSLQLTYKWKSETLSFDSKNFAFGADSSAESACIAEVRFEGLKGSVKPEEAALSLLTSDGGHLSMEPLGSQRTQIHAQKIEYNLYQTYVTGHNCMVGDRATLNTQTSIDDQRSLPPGPSSAPLRSLTDDTTQHESTYSEK